MSKLQEGNVIKLEKGHTVYAKIPKHFIYENRIGSFDVERTNITIGKDKNGLNTDFLEGKYIVTKTQVDGGGTGHGPHDVFPDGYHVYCRSVCGEYDKPIEVDFYQSGSFTAMIKEDDIEVVGQAEAEYKIKEI